MGMIIVDLFHNNGLAPLVHCHHCRGFKSTIRIPLIRVRFMRIPIELGGYWSLVSQLAAPVINWPRLAPFSLLLPVNFRSAFCRQSLRGRRPSPRWCLVPSGRTTAFAYDICGCRQWCSNSVTAIRYRLV